MPITPGQIKFFEEALLQIGVQRLAVKWRARTNQSNANPQPQHILLEMGRLLLKPRAEQIAELKSWRDEYLVQLQAQHDVADDAAALEKSRLVTAISDGDSFDPDGGGT